MLQVDLKKNLPATDNSAADAILAWRNYAIVILLSRE